MPNRRTPDADGSAGSWHSPPGVNLYATIILRPKIPLVEVPQLSLVAGVAAAEALETVAPGIVTLKWPNDLWLNGRKTGGIIAEAITDSRQRLSCVLLGIGLNLNLALEDIPHDLRDKATSVRIATGRECSRPEIAAALFNRLTLAIWKLRPKASPPFGRFSSATWRSRAGG